MLERFQEYIRDEALFGASDKVVLAVSGGMDSIVMVDLFSRSRIDFSIAHANFKLRGDESDGDEAFTRLLAEKYGAPFYSEY